MLLKIYSSFAYLLVLLLSLRKEVLASTSDVEVICHGDNPSECYPKIFQPSEEFQVIHDDQSIPAGLHIRLNMETGVKEAKLNKDEDVEMGTVVNDLNVERGSNSSALALIEESVLDAVIVNETDHKDSKSFEELSDAYGLVRQPPVSSDDGSLFIDNMNVVKAMSTTTPDSAILRPAFEALEELAHDVSWGLHLAKDSVIVHKLATFLSSQTQNDSNLRAGAALLLGTAIQNNPAALQSALGHFYNDEWPTGPLESVITAMIHEQLPQLITRMVYLLSSLCQDQKQLLRFIEADGLQLLLMQFDAENTGNDRDKLRGKIANFVLDHFLQQESYAVLHKKQDGKQKKLESSETTAESSEIEDENSWVVVEKRDGPNANSKPERGNNQLQPWCGALSTAITKWEGKSDASFTSNVANMRSVYEALEAKLHESGSSCK
jgi:nucleotide exchange factor SIL1